MKKQLISLRKNLRNIASMVAGLFLLPLYTYAASASIQDLLTNISFFIKLVLIPVLFGLAFLFFLVNMLKYFVIGGASEEARAKGKKNVLYSLIAFVFLISIWGIVTLLLNGLDIESTDSICPDYMENCNDLTGGTVARNSFGSVTFPGSGTTGRTVRRSGSSGTGTTGGGSTNNYSTRVGDTGSGGSGNGSNSAGLAELIFGTGKDSALFTRYTGEPRAIYQTPSIAATASCESGMNTLLFANEVETTQAAYALYKDNTGATRWKNLTDLHSTNHITYDKDALDALLSTNVSNVHIIHTHQKNRIKNLGLIMEGHGPSAADMSAMCNNDDTRFTYAVVDWSGIWTFSQQSDTCPYTVVAKNTLPLIETYTTMASLEASTRQAELFAYTNASITPTQHQDYFAGINTAELSSLTPKEVLALSAFYQNYASTTLAYKKTVGAFCSTY